MEYGEAINPDALERAVSIARNMVKEDSRPLTVIAAEAVSKAFCVCVVDGEDAAERRFSDVHRSLIEAVVQRAEAWQAFSASDEATSREDRQWH